MTETSQFLLEMNLVIFDIDGTVVNSVEADDSCFIQTFIDLYQIDLTGVDWNDFEHVTDSGLTHSIFQKNFGVSPTKSDFNKIQDHFFNLISLRGDEFQEILGASKFINLLGQSPNTVVAFATGGWRKSACIKLQALNLTADNIVLRSADDHFKRTEITQLAIDASKKAHGVKEFESVTYFGDGLWDLRAAHELGIAFVGLDSKGDNKLAHHGVKVVLRDYNSVDETLFKRAQANNT